MPAGMGFSFFVESSFVELHNEQCHDLYAKGTASSLPVRVAVYEQCLLHRVLTLCATGVPPVPLPHKMMTGRTCAHASTLSCVVLPAVRQCPQQWNAAAHELLQYTDEAVALSV
jgi:hypothetical protein